MRSRKGIIKFISTFLFVVFLSFVSGAVLAEETSTEGGATTYQSAQTQYVKEVNVWKKIREKLIQAREKYKKFKDASDKSAYEERAKEFLEKTIDVLIKRLESLKVWVSNRKSIADEEKQNIISKIDQDITTLESYKTGLPEATPDQIKEKAKEIRKYWRNHRVKIKQIIGQIWVARTDWVTKRFETISSKVEEKIDALKKAGKDTSQLEEWFSDFKKNLKLAESERDQAKESYKEITSISDANKLFSEIRQHIINSRNYLRQAHKDLVKIIKSLKEASNVQDKQETSVPPAEEDNDNQVFDE